MTWYKWLCILLRWWCCEFVLSLSVKLVHVLCAQVVCTFGSMVFASILLVRGIWSGVTYIRENRYNYIHRIDNDDSRWSRVQTAGWYFAFLLCGQTHTHPALAGSRIKRNIRVTNERVLPVHCQLGWLLLLLPHSWTGMKQIHSYLNRISGSSRPGRVEDWCLSWWELIGAGEKKEMKLRWRMFAVLIALHLEVPG